MRKGINQKRKLAQINTQVSYCNQRDFFDIIDMHTLIADGLYLWWAVTGCVAFDQLETPCQIFVAIAIIQQKNSNTTAPDRIIFINNIIARTAWFFITRK